MAARARDADYLLERKRKARTTRTQVWDSRDAPILQNPSVSNVSDSSKLGTALEPAANIANQFEEGTLEVLQELTAAAMASATALQRRLEEFTAMALSREAAREKETASLFADLTTEIQGLSVSLGELQERQDGQVATLETLQESVISLAESFAELQEEHALRDAPSPAVADRLCDTLTNHVDVLVQQGDALTSTDLARAVQDLRERVDSLSGRPNIPFTVFDQVARLTFVVTVAAAAGGLCGLIIGHLQQVSATEKIVTGIISAVGGALGSEMVKRQDKSR